MNPSNPSATEMQEIEQIYFEQIRQQTRKATNPLLAARSAVATARREALANSFDFQFSDRWL